MCCHRNCCCRMGSICVVIPLNIHWSWIPTSTRNLGGILPSPQHSPWIYPSSTIKPTDKLTSEIRGTTGSIGRRPSSRTSSRVKSRNGSDRSSISTWSISTNRSSIVRRIHRESCNNLSCWTHSSSSGSFNHPSEVVSEDSISSWCLYKESREWCCQKCSEYDSTSKGKSSRINWKRSFLKCFHTKEKKE